MNEADTRAELIEPQLKANGWGVVDGSRILREYHITAGKIQTGGVRAKPLIADYILVYKNRKIACIEAKSDETEVAEAKLPDLLTLKYDALEDATDELGTVSDIRSTFIDFQKHLYARKVA